MIKIGIKDLKRIAKGDIPDILSGNPFVVIRHSVHILGMTDVDWAWDISFSPDIDDAYEIPRSMALDIIRNNRMSLSHRENCGQIYEMSGNPFHKKYEHTYSRQIQYETTENRKNQRKRNGYSTRCAICA